MIKVCTSIKPDFSIVERYLNDSFESAQMSNFGPCYERLCDELSVFLNLPAGKKIVLTSSGHTALMAAYGRFINRGYDFINGPSYTFPSTWQATPAEMEYKPYENIYSLDPGCLWDSILSVVAPLSTIPNFESITNTFGHCGYWAPIVIDGAATFGTKDIYKYGHYYCLSFHATKTFPLGEGGAVICDACEEKETKAFLNFGVDKKKKMHRAGINGKISEYACAIGLSILPKMNEVIDKRLRNADIYKKRLGSLVPKSWVDDTVYQTFPIFFPSARKAKQARKLLTENNIQNLQYYKPYNPVSTKYAQDKYNKNICLPVHQDVNPQDIDFICDLILSV